MPRRWHFVKHRVRSGDIGSVLDWNGPAVLSSVKNDLFDGTIARRRQLGDVYVFDPICTVPRLPAGVQRVGWSPLHAARTVPGAIEISTALLDAAPREGVTNGSYWTSKGQALLWPMLFAAAHAPDRTMADVVRWLPAQDGNPEPPAGGPAGAGAPQPDAEHVGEIRTVLRHYAAVGEERVAIQARHTLDQFDGFFRLDHRTRSDIYSTSQTLVQPWEDPNISFASSPAAGRVADLRQVLDGANTFYGWQLGSQARNRGSLHADFWDGTAIELASRGRIAVFPVTEWWKEQPKRDRSEFGVRNGLVISIETPIETADLWTPVAAQVGIPVVAET